MKARDRPPRRPGWPRRPGCPPLPRLGSVVSERGSAAAEVVILTPLLVAFALVILLGGRLANAAQYLDDAARTAVESAVAASTAAQARAQAAATAGYELARDGLACRPYSIAVNVGDFRAGGSVSVRIRCVVELATLGLPGLPGSVSLSAQTSAPIELYREVG